MNDYFFKSKIKGTALILTITLLIIIAVSVTISIGISISDIKSAQREGLKIRALYVATAGYEAAIAELKNRTVLSGGDWSILDSIVGTLYDKEPFGIDRDGDGKLDFIMGYYTVTVSLVGSGSFERIYTIESIGIVPKGSISNGAFLSKAKITGKVKYSFDRSPAFQYSYYMNHFGWMCAGNADWHFNGNMGAAGVFSWYNSRVEIKGTPQWKNYNPDTGKLEYPVKYTPKPEYRDEIPPSAQDLINEPIRGGTIAGFQIEGAGNLLGGPKDIYPYQPNIRIPLLTKEYFKNLEQEAYQNQNYIKVGNKYVCDGVYGDGQLPTGEENSQWRQELIQHGYNPQDEVAFFRNGNLYLVGTDENPIEIKGTVVVKGNLFIKGEIKGKGAIYVRGNIYIGGNLTYVNSPDFNKMKQAVTQEQIENWIKENKDKDSLGLYAKGTIAVGNYNKYVNNQLVRNWLNAPENESAEAKNGFDGMPNTHDIGEDEPDVWNVQRYTQEDAEKGRIPPGYNVGDAVPGTGEDFDGDGKQDGRITQDDFRPRCGEDMEDYNSMYETISYETWGNVEYNFCKLLKECTTSNVKRVDAALFTNKAYTAWVNSGFKLNGILISRLEAGVCGNKMEMNYDRRLMGGGGNLGFEVPRVWQDVKTLSYKVEVY